MTVERPATRRGRRSGIVVVTTCAVFLPWLTANAPAYAVTNEVVLPAAGHPAWLEAAAGRLLTMNRRGAVEQRSIRTDPTGGRVTVGRASSLFPEASDAGAPFASGGHAARLTLVGNGSVSRIVTVVDNATVVRRYRFAKEAESPFVSGRRVLVHEMTWGNDPWKSVSVLVDIQTGKRTTEPETGGIDGDHIAYINKAGEVRVRDLVTGREKVVHRAQNFKLDPAHTTVLIKGNWVVYVIGVGYGTTSDAGAVNFVTGKHVTLPSNIQPGLEVSAIRLADGVAAWMDLDTAKVHVLWLDTGQQQIVGTLYSATDNSWPGWLALSDEFVAWFAPDGRRHVRALAPPARGAPRGLGVLAPSSFSPNGDGANDTYHVVVDTTRPLTSWTLTIKNKSGNTIRTLTGNAPHGNIRATWNGRDSNGRLVPASTYRWKLTGSGPSGHLVSARNTVITGAVTT